MRYAVKVLHSANEIGKTLAPEIKTAARDALRVLAEHPFAGKELQRELSDFRSYRFMRYRIIYKVDDRQKIIWVYAICHRSTVYENLTEYVMKYGKPE